MVQLEARTQIRMHQINVGKRLQQLDYYNILKYQAKRTFLMF